MADALASHVRAKGVKIVLDCVVNKISTTDADAVLVEGVEVRGLYLRRASTTEQDLPRFLVNARAAWLFVCRCSFRATMQLSSRVPSSRRP